MASDEHGRRTSRPAWVDSVEEKRDAIEAIAKADVPLSEDCKNLLNEYAEITGDLTAYEGRYVYVAKAESGEVKIGVSKQPESRVSQLRTGNPGDVELVTKARLPNSDKAESQLHKEYSEYRTSGEWFDLPEDEEKDLQRRLADLQGMVGYE